MTLRGAYGGTAAAIVNTPFLEGLQAVSGILEATTEAVDHVVFGPAMDPVKDWHVELGAAVATPLMLAVLKDVGANTEIDIWDLTDNTVLDAGAVPLTTVTITGAATPTSIAAAMGYIIVGSEDGVTIIEPHDGAWTERTEGWPKSLSASTTPALTDNDVVDVAAGYSDQPRLDPRSSGPMPTFGLEYGTGVDFVALIKDDGNVFNQAGNPESFQPVLIAQGHFWYGDQSGSGARLARSDDPISAIQADDWEDTNIFRGGSNESAAILGVNTDVDYANQVFAMADVDGLSFGNGPFPAMGAKINRTYNSGWQNGDIRGAWLANSKTADRSTNIPTNSLTENGTVTEAAWGTGTEIKGYSDFSAANNLTRASDADWDVITTGAAYESIWFKNAGNGAVERLMGFSKADDTIRFIINLAADGTISCVDDGASAAVTTASVAAYDDGLPHKVDFVRRSSTERELWIDGHLVAANTTDAGSLTDTGNLPFAIGVDADGSTEPATASTLALARLSTTAPTAAQIRHMYETERRMLEADAKCLLQSGSTDAVLDVSVDPVTGKTAVLQTDSLAIFDGLTIDREIALPAGAANWGHVTLYGDDLFTITDADVSIEIAAKDLRHESELLRGDALPKIVDLSRAKVLLYQTGTNPATIGMSQNIKSVTRSALGQYDVEFEVPFKSNTYVALANALGSDPRPVNTTLFTPTSLRIKVENNAGTDLDSAWNLAVFGELENE